MGPDLIVLLTILVALILYAVLAGADFGAGIWELDGTLHASKKERELIFRAITPVWEANHVWLIFVLVGLLNGFPAAFAALCRALWLPLLLALVGIIFRGAAFAFRSYSSRGEDQHAVWEWVFALSSAAAPFFLGASVGSIASGRLAVSPRGEFAGSFLTGWLSPLAIYAAFFSVGMCAYLAAVYLTRETQMAGDAHLAARWRQRALSTGTVMGVLAVAGLVVIAVEAPRLWDGFRERAWPFIVFSVGAGASSLAALWWRHRFLAVLGAAGAVGTVLIGWGVAQFPLIVPPTITVADARSPDPVLWAMVAGIAGGAILVVPSLVYLLVLFKSQRTNPVA